MKKLQINDQQDLYASVLYYGLLKDLEYIEEEMQSKEPIASDENNNKLKNF